MIRILCTGDSHTWGQGATGVWESLDPPPVAGDLRLDSFRHNGYVNVLRRMIERATGSTSCEWEAKTLAEMAGAPYQPPAAALTAATPLTVPFTGALLRFEVKCDTSPTAFSWTVDGNTRQERLPAAQSDNDYRLFTHHLTEGDHTLTFTVQNGTCLLYRAESYSGMAAVINAGVGSQPTARYREAFWDSHIAAVKPTLVLAEAHTINDWLSGVTPAQYEKQLVRLLTSYKQLDAAVALLTVCPIGGAQKRPDTADEYTAFVEASRRAANAANVPLCDAHALCSVLVADMTPDERAAYLLDDIWHPNERGHAIYAQLAAGWIAQTLSLTIF